MSMQNHSENPITPNNKEEVYDRDWHKAQADVFSYLGLMTILFTLLSMVLSSVVEFFLPSVRKFLPGFLSDQMLTVFIPLYLIIVPFIYWMLGRIRRKDEITVEKKPLSTGFYLQMVIVAFGMIYIGNYLSLGLAAILNQSGLPTVNPVETLLESINIWEAFFYTVIAAPIAEELIFRQGMISLMLPYGERTAILMSSLFFALVHGNFYQLIYTFGLGCALGYLYVKSGRLRDVIGLHALINLIGGVLPLLLMKHIDDNFLDQMETFSYMVEEAPEESIHLLMDNILPLSGLLFLSFFTIFSIVATIIILLRKGKSIQFESGETPLRKGYRFKTIFANPGTLLSILFYLALLTVGVLWQL